MRKACAKPTNAVTLAETALENQNTENPFPIGNLCSEILAVQSAQNWHPQRTTDSLDGARDWGVLVQRQVRASLVVIFLVRFEQMSEVPLTKNRVHPFRV
jgi:hypothetical protein